MAEVYTNHVKLPPVWTRAQRQGFIAKTAATLSRQIADLAAELGEQAVTEWTSEHGQHPDYLTKVGLLNTATRGDTGSGTPQRMVCDLLVSMPGGGVPSFHTGRLPVELAPRCTSPLRSSATSAA